eukprot:scaffold15324_cov112-Isochrysis_galbana.AAC.8
MTPLSVHSRGGGTTIRQVPSPPGAVVDWHSSPSRRRSSALAATPPERTRVCGAQPSASACEEGRRCRRGEGTRGMG